MRTAEVLTLSLPSDLAREVEKLARQEGCTKSDLVRLALRRYIEECRWRGLQRYGARRARVLGLGTGDVGRAIREYRGDRKSLTGR